MSEQFERYPGRELYFPLLYVGRTVVAQSVVTRLPTEPLPTDPIERDMMIRKAALSDLAVEFGEPITGLVKKGAVLGTDKVLLRSRGTRRSFSVSPALIEGSPPELEPLARINLFFEPAPNR